MLSNNPVIRDCYFRCYVRVNQKLFVIRREKNSEEISQCAQWCTISFSVEHFNFYPAAVEMG